MAGASCDDVFIIVLFYAFLGFTKTNVFDYLSVALVPLSIFLVILFGLAVGFILIVLANKLNFLDFKKGRRRENKRLIYSPEKGVFS